MKAAATAWGRRNSPCFHFDENTFHHFSQVVLPAEAQEPILAKPVRNALTEWLTEVWAKDKLAEVGLKERRRALFSGPAGDREDDTSPSSRSSARPTDGDHSAR
jgi:hypothetical protein